MYVYKKVKKNGIHKKNGVALKKKKNNDNLLKACF